MNTGASNSGADDFRVKGTIEIEIDQDALQRDIEIAAAKVKVQPKIDADASPGAKTRKKKPIRWPDAWELENEIFREKLQSVSENEMEGTKRRRGGRGAQAVDRAGRWAFKQATNRVGGTGASVARSAAKGMTATTGAALAGGAALGGIALGVAAIAVTAARMPAHIAKALQNSEMSPALSAIQLQMEQRSRVRTIVKGEIRGNSLSQLAAATDEVRSEVNLLASHLMATLDKHAFTNMMSNIAAILAWLRRRFGIEDEADAAHLAQLHAVYAALMNTAKQLELDASNPLPLPRQRMDRGRPSRTNIDDPRNR